MTSMDGFSLEDDPDDNNMFDEASFFEEEPSDEELDFDSLANEELD